MKTKKYKENLIEKELNKWIHYFSSFYSRKPTNEEMEVMKKTIRKEIEKSDI